MDKREFLRTLGGISVSGLLRPDLLGKGLAARCAALPPTVLAEDEPFWAEIRKRYDLPSDRIDLEQGYYSRMEGSVLDAFTENARSVNRDAAFYMRTRQAEDKLAARSAIAQLAGCGVEELIITRNTTESLDTVIAGHDWKAGDEAVMAKQDYGAMLDMFDLQARRYGMQNRLVSLPMDPRSDDELVTLYSNAITAKTKLLMICHMVNITGQILPVQKIVAMAHAKGVPVMVDGAHAFAHLDFKIPQLGCDFYGASLHKWLGCPLGAGLLYVKKERIGALWPIYGDRSCADTDIQKLNHTGTHPVHTDLSIARAWSCHHAIGSARKEARLRFLQQYWTNKVRGATKIRLFTPSDPQRACAIATVGIEGMAPIDLAKALLSQHRIFTVAIDHAGVHGVRVTPHVYTSLAELDTLVNALQQLAAQ